MQNDLKELKQKFINWEEALEILKSLENEIFYEKSSFNLFKT
jgi:hypothetical protein